MAEISLPKRSSSSFKLPQKGVITSLRSWHPFTDSLFNHKLAFIGHIKGFNWAGAKTCMAQTVLTSISLPRLFLGSLHKWSILLYEPATSRVWKNNHKLEHFWLYLFDSVLALYKQKDEILRQFYNFYNLSQNVANVDILQHDFKFFFKKLQFWDIYDRTMKSLDLAQFTKKEINLWFYN